jgi:hypothetical protein
MTAHRQRSYDTEKTAFPKTFLLKSPRSQAAYEIYRLTADFSALLVVFSDAFAVVKCSAAAGLASPVLAALMDFVEAVLLTGDFLLDPEPVGFAVDLEEVVAQQWNAAAALPQRRQINRHHMDAVVMR